MKIKKYKQYFPDGIDCKTICGHSKASIICAYELLSYLGLPGFFKKDFRPMRLTVVDFKGTDLGDYTLTGILDDSGCLDALGHEAANYMRILLGRIPSWQLFSVKVFLSGFMLQFCHFLDEASEDGAYESSQFLDIYFDRPPYLKLKIDIDTDDEHPAETYFVTEWVDEVSDEEKVSLDYCLEGKKQYHSIFGEDKKGYYELITEAD